MSAAIPIWQVLGTVDYSVAQAWNLHLGYRSLNFSITGSEGRFGFNVHMRGPIIAGTFRFWSSGNSENNGTIGLISITRFKPGPSNSPRECNNSAHAQERATEPIARGRLGLGKR